MGSRAYCFFPDVSTRAHGPLLPSALPEYDVVFTTKSFGLNDLREIGVRESRLLMHAFDPDLHRSLALTADDCVRYGCDVSFIGTWSPKKERYLSTLAEKESVVLRVWGAQWDRARTASLRGAIQGTTIEGDEYVRAIRASKINLALLSEQRPGASAGDQITSRTFHIPAAGGFMLHERTDELLALYEEDEHVACFGPPDEMASAVTRWLGDAAGRRRVAHAGAALTRKTHGWDRRMGELLAYHQPLRRT